jgi:hypothetical protein
MGAHIRPDRHCSHQEIGAARRERLERVSPDGTSDQVEGGRVSARHDSGSKFQNEDDGSKFRSQDLQGGLYFVR